MLRYNLDNLGWFQFESMVQSLLKSNFGLDIESWGGRGDHGIDAFFEGALEFPRKGELQEGPFIFQVKFVEEANAAGAKPRPRIVSAVKSEIKKVKTRGKYSKAKSVYVVLTNVALSVELRTEIKELLRNAFHNFKVLVLGGKDICDILDNFPNIRTSFPQILGLGDLNALLTAVVAKPIIERSKGMIEEARELAPIFYPTEAYNNTLIKLTKYHFAVLEGAPEVGKTAIARVIGLARLSNGWEAHECLSPNEFFQIHSLEKPQIFIADDAFGSTEYDPSKSSEWAHDLDRIIRRLDSQHWLIWTARKHILEIALGRIRLQGKGEDFPNPGAVLIDVGDLTQTEKAMILYRHAKAAGLHIEARNLIKEHARHIVLSNHFTPERIRRFVRNSLPALIENYKSGKLKKEDLKSAIEKEIREPTKSLKQAFDCLPENHKRLLISRLDVSRNYGIVLIIEKDSTASFERHRPKDSKESYEKIESDLLLSFLKKTEYGEGWIHPSIRDLVIDYLISVEPERHNFLSVCSLSGISLALSVGGGTEGTRMFPFIVDSNDREIVKTRSKELIKELPTRKIIELMKIINESRLRSSELKNAELITFIEELFEITLDHVLKRWLEKQEPLDNELLNLYFEMSQLSKSYRPSPPLEPTWDMILLKLDKALKKASTEGYIDELRGIDELFKLVEIIEKNEPRYLQFINYPKCLSKYATEFIKLFIDEAECSYDIDAEEDRLYDLYMSESEKYDNLVEISEKLFNLGINIEIDMKPEDVLASLARESEYWKENSVEYYMAEPDYEGSYSSESRISTETLFSDL